MNNPLDRNIKIIKIDGFTGKSPEKNLNQEKRLNQADRRKLHTYIADDKRSGIADRRKQKNKVTQ